MSDQLARELVSHALNDALLEHWVFYALLLAVFVVTTALSVFLSTYIATRAKAYATRTDFEELLRQLKATTQAAEAVRSAFGHADWADREWRTLRRIKLEELITVFQESRQWLGDHLSNSIVVPRVSTKNAPIWRAQVLIALYFPEMKAEGDEFYRVWFECLNWLNSKVDEITKREAAVLPRLQALSALDVEYLEHHKNLTTAIGMCLGRAGQLMKIVVTVEPPG